jgi:OPA family glycerol-3-phosphate transporter-like MFS transporter
MTHTTSPAVASRWTRGQLLTLAILTLGYTGFYLCRSNYAVSKPQILDEFAKGKVPDTDVIDKTSLGVIDSVGTLCYAFGKILAGVAADFASPRAVFLGAMAASILATLAFAIAPGRPGFLAAWAVNRSVQSAGWGALTKVAAHWFAPAQYGRAMAVLALSYFFGDALARLLYGELLAGGMSWRGLYFVGAASLTGILLLSLFTLKNDPRDLGEPPVPVAPDSVYADTAARSRPEGLTRLLVPLLTSPAFWLVCVMSAGLTFARETFNAWTPTYLRESAGLSPADAARASSLFPFFGGISVLTAGWISDRLMGGRRGLLMFLMLVPACVCLVGLARIDPSTAPAWLPQALISGTALSMLGPYAFLSGAIALDLGSRKGSATAAGLVDAAGYFAGALAGAPIAAIAQKKGWAAAFSTLAAAVAIVTLAALLYWIVKDRRGTQRT